MESKPVVVSIERALIILDLLAQTPAGMGTRGISHKLGYSAGSVQKILNTLRAQGFVSKSPDTDKYVLGIAALRLARLIISQMDLSTVARPYLEELADLTGETIFLGVRDGTQCIYIDKITSKQEIRMDAPVGAIRPFNCTAIGKVLLAYASEDAIDQLAQAEAFVKSTERSITDPEELRQEIVRVRKQGFAYDGREYNPSAACVAAPVLDHMGEVVAAISVSGPAERIERQREQLGETVRQEADRLSAALGHAPARQAPHRQG
jgi:IclR family KDG regulon transcriptional repressor